MKYRNISSGIIPVVGFQVLPGREVELTEKDLLKPQVIPYLNPKYLVSVTATSESLPKVPSVRLEVPKNLVLDGMPESKGVTVVPQVSTEEELKAVQAEEDSYKTVAVLTATMDHGAAVQSIVEVSTDKINATVEELKGLTSWKKRNEFIAAITDLSFLQALSLEVSGKTKEAVEVRIEELQKK